MKREADFSQIKKILKGERPDRPTPFELIIGDHVFEHFLNEKSPGYGAGEVFERYKVRGYLAAGYDYATVYASDFDIVNNWSDEAETVSLNGNVTITDWESFEKFTWKDPEAFDTERLERMKEILPDGAKLAVMGPGGVLENVTSLVGFDNLCYMLYDDPELLETIFNEVGKRLLKYYQMAVEYPTVGMLISNDDWGFNSQTFLSVKDMEKYVFPWHKKIVETAHTHGKPIILHSCGYFKDMIEPVTNVLGYDGKHSYEDKIMPVEQAYKEWSDHISVIGGIDVNFLATADIEEIKNRCRAMIEMSSEKGRYMLGSGNSIPEYVPLDHYLAMRSVLEMNI